MPAANEREAPHVQLNQLAQREFRRHIELARAVGKPLMIHDRDAHADVLRIVGESPGLTAVVFHAFSGDAEMAQHCVAAGYLLSFPGGNGNSEEGVNSTFNVDASVSYKLTGNLTLSLEGINLTDDYNDRYVDVTDRVSN